MTWNGNDLWYVNRGTILSTAQLAKSWADYHFWLNCTSISDLFVDVISKKISQSWLLNSVPPHWYCRIGPIIPIYLTTRRNSSLVIHRWIIEMTSTSFQEVYLIFGSNNYGINIKEFVCCRKTWGKRFLKKMIDVNGWSSKIGWGERFCSQESDLCHITIPP